jgi:hypothetical protein
VSRGEAICFLDSDDTLFPCAIERAMAEMSRSHSATKVQWPLQVTDAHGQATGELSTKQTPPEGDLSEIVMRDGPLYDFHLHTGSLYPRWLLERVLPVPEPPYQHGADVYLITLAPAFGEVVNVSEPLGTYRNHGANNYRGRELDDARIRDCIRRFEVNCEALARHLGLQGKAADVERWKQRNFNYQWPSRLLRAKQDLERLVPGGASYVLIGGVEWGDSEPVKGRYALPFLEDQGMYAGSPTDAQQAIGELERLRQAGASVVAIWWTAFWWLDHYAPFAQDLRARFECTLDAEHLIVFDLERPRHALLCKEAAARSQEAEEQCSAFVWR